MTIFETVNRIREYLSICPGATRDNVAACFQLSPDIAERFLNVMVRDKVVERRQLAKGKNTGDWGYFVKN